MLTAISNKKLTKLVATRPSQEDSPIYPPLPPIPPFPLSPSCEGFILITHRPTIHRDPQANHLQGFFQISSHLFSLHFCFFPLEFEGKPALLCTSLCLLGILLRVVLSAITALLNALDTVYKGISHFPIISLPMLMMKPRGFTSSLTRVSGYQYQPKGPAFFQSGTTFTKIHSSTISNQPYI